VINDTYGHPVGDKALMDLTDCLRLTFRHHDIIGRIGGDEFGVIAINAEAESGDLLKENILQMVKARNETSSELYQLSLSIGGAYYSGRDEVAVNDLIYTADLALYASKKRESPRVVLSL